MKTCPASKLFQKFSYHIDGPPQTFRDFSLPRVPLYTKKNLQHCMKDVSAWYSGVIMKQTLQFSDFIEKSVQKLNKLKGVSDTFAALHIRSAGKISEAEILAAFDYLRHLEKICVLYGQDFKSCKIGTHCWVATDSYHNVAEFMRSSKDDVRKKFRKSTLSENSFDNKNFSYYRYSQRSAIQLVHDLKLLVDSELAIGTFTSIFLMYVFES